MSNIYIQEPLTSGKVVLSTTYGELEIELWTKECPMTCRNFIQLCMEGYYDGTIFHRLVKGFILQGGDPTGTGHGGESAFGAPFKDEFHQRLRYNRRGLVGMANAGKNDNGSQFFFTLDASPELQGKNTLFGKVTGDTIFNLMKMAEIEVAANERPVFPPKINRAEILVNPFDDILPRQIQAPLVTKEDAANLKKPANKGSKNFSLLSFGEEAEEEEQQIAAIPDPPQAGKSAHDLLNEKHLRKETIDLGDDLDKVKVAEALRAKIAGLSKSNASTAADAASSVDGKESKKRAAPSDNGSEFKTKKELETERLREESKRLKREIQDGKKAWDNEKTLAEETARAKSKDQSDEKLSSVPAVFDEYDQLSAYKPKKGSKKSSSADKSKREEETLAYLAKFKSKLNAAKDNGPTGSAAVEEQEGEADKETGWLSHALVFVPDLSLPKERAPEDEYELYDPRNVLVQRRREKEKKSSDRHKSKRDDL